MILLIGPWGGVGFNSTSLYFRTNIDDLAPHLIHDVEYRYFDFGIGEERAFRCRNCRRFTPLIPGSVDHIIPRSTLTVQYVRRAGELYDSVTYSHGTAKVCIGGKLQLIYKQDGSIGTYDYEVNEEEELLSVNGHVIPVRTALENDMQNLQLMCCYCNSFKGNRT